MHDCANNAKLARSFLDMSKQRSKLQTSSRSIAQMEARGKAFCLSLVIAHIHHGLRAQSPKLREISGRKVAIAMIAKAVRPPRHYRNHKSNESLLVLVAFLTNVILRAYAFAQAQRRWRELRWQPSERVGRSLVLLEPWRGLAVAQRGASPRLPLQQGQRRHRRQR